MEEQLRSSEENYRLISENANDLIDILNEKWELEYVNESVYSTLLRFSKEDLLRKSLLDYVHPDDVKSIVSALQETSKVGEGKIELRIKDKINKYFWFGIRGKMFMDSLGEKKVLIISRDITEQKEAERAIIKKNLEFSALLKASRAVLEYEKFEELIRIIFNSCVSLIGNIDGFVGMLTPDKKIIQVLFLDSQGLTRDVDTKLSLPIRGLLKEGVNSKEIKYYNNLLNSDWKQLLPKGHLALKNVMFVPLIINGEIEGLIGLTNKPGEFNEDDTKLVTTFAQIAAIALINSSNLESLEKSEQKFRDLNRILEQKVEERTYELKRSEEKIRNLINNISDVLMEGDIDGTITFLSPQIYDIIGHQPKELIGIEYMELIHSEDKLAYKKLINTTLKAGSKFSMELRIMHKKGYFIPISINGSIGEINNKLKMFVIIKDITEKRKIDEMMKSEIKKLTELDQIRNDLIRRISHELKTPLISIFSGSQYLLDHSIDKVKDHNHHIIELIHLGGYRLKNLADNLILAYNIDLKELNLSLKRKNIIQIIKNCVEDIVFQAKKRKIFINIELLKELYIEADKSTIKRAISNILSNAVKNTPTNGNIFVSTFDHPNYIDIIVKDDGVGLTKKENLLLFKRFGKIERYGKGMDVDIEGAGLGLYIANEIVKLHNGEIIVKSKGRNKGSTFIIRLQRN